MSPDNPKALYDTIHRRAGITILGLLVATGFILASRLHRNSASMQAENNAINHDYNGSPISRGAGGYPAWPAGMKTVSPVSTIPESSIIIFVLTTSGAPVTGAVVNGVTPGGAYTNSDGMFTTSAAPGKHRLTISRLPSGYHVAGSATKSFSVRRGETANATFRVTSIEADRVTGDVIAPDGKPAAGAILQLCSVKDQSPRRSGPAEWGRFDVRMHPLTQTGALSKGVSVSDRGGHFAIDADWLNNGRLLWASFGATEATQVGVRVVNGGRYVLRLHHGIMGALTGKVVEVSGKPVKGAKVGLIRLRARGIRIVSPPAAITGADGRYEIDSLPTEGIYAVHIFPDRYRPADYPKAGSVAASIVLRPGETRTVPPIVVTRWTQTRRG